MLPMLAGIILGRSYGADAAMYSVARCIALLLSVLMLLLHVNYTRFSMYMRPWFPGLVFQLFILTLAALHTASGLPEHQPDHFSSSRAEGFLIEVCTEPQEGPSITRCEVRVLSGLRSSAPIRCEGKMLLSLQKEPDLSNTISIGDRLIVPGRFTTIQGPRNPGEFDYASYMSNRGLRHQAFFKMSEVEYAGHAAWNYMYAAVELRRKVVRKLDTYVGNKESAAVISTLLLGYKADLRRDILNTYSSTGVMHVLSVSGMHVAIVAALAGYLLGFWKGRKLSVIQALLIIALVWMYTLLSGLSAAACRSAVMISFVIAGRLLDRNADMLNCVPAAAFFQLLFTPMWLFDVGFQLSYIAVTGLVILYPLMNGAFAFKNRAFKTLWSYLAFSMAAQLATFPLCLYYFNQFPVYFLASNLFIMLPVTVVMYSGVGFLLLAFIPFTEVPLRTMAWLMENGIGVLHYGLRVIEKLPFSSMHGYRLHLTFYLLIYLLVATLYVAVLKKSKQALWCSLIIGLCIASTYSVCGLIVWKRTSVVIYAVRNHFAMAFIRRGTATIVSDMNVDDKAMAYSVMPLIRDRNLELKKIVNTRSSFYEADFKISSGRIRFYDLELDIIEGDGHSGSKGRPLSVTTGNARSVAGGRNTRRIILLHNDPYVDLLQFDNLTFVVVGDKNRGRNIAHWLEQAESLEMKVHDLKRMNACELEW
ncbi:MAG: ComEC/Rec2 family competence protein [Arcticibacter sp.]